LGYPLPKIESSLVHGINQTTTLKKYGQISGSVCQLWLFDSVTHVARHTVATTIALNNGITKEVIAKMLGHSTTKEIDLYAIVEQQLIESQMIVAGISWGELREIAVQQGPPTC